MLPFLNAGVDPTLEYLTDGITESIINSLSQLNGLRIVPRSLVFRYKGLQADPATVGLALNARTILTGRVVQQGDILNIQAELVDASTESQLWGEQFRQRISDLVTVQEEIAWQISEALRLKLTGDQKTRLRKRPTANAEAAQAYMRGRFEWNNWTAEGFRLAVEHFEQAIALDPKHAPAYAGISDCYSAMAYYGFVPPDVGYPRSRDAAEKALAIDPDVADAHASLALVSLLWQFDWATAEREFTTALRLNPNLAGAHATYAIYLMTVGRHDEALEQARTAQQLDPLPLLINMTVCWALHFGGRSEEAVRETRRTRELAAGFHEAGNLLMALYEHLDRFEDAARLTFEQPIYGVRIDGTVLLEAYHSGGPDAYWHKRIEFLDGALVDAPPAIHYGYAVLYTRLGDTGRAIDHLEQLVDARSSNPSSSPSSPASASCTASRAFSACSAGWVRPRLQHRIQRRHDRHRHAGAGRPAHDRSLKRLHFDPLADRQIDQQGRAHAPRDVREVSADAVDRVRRHRHPLRPRHPLDFAAAFQQLAADLLVRPQRPNRLPCRAGESGERGEKDELLPDRHPAVVHRLHLDVGAGHGIPDRAHAIRQARQIAEDLADHDAPVGAGLLDDAGRHNRRRHVGRAADHRRLAVARRELGDGVDAVLQRQDRRRRAEHGRHHRQRRVVVVGLDRDDDDVHGPHPRRILLGRRPDHEIAEGRRFGSRAHGREWRPGGRRGR